MELPHTLPTDGPCPFEKTRVGKEPTWVEGYVGMRLSYEDMGMHVFMVHVSLHTDKTHKHMHTRARTHTLTHSHLTHKHTHIHTHTHRSGGVGPRIGEPDNLELAFRFGVRLPYSHAL